MAEEPTYTEYRADPSALRRNKSGRLRSGDFDYPAFPFEAPAELRERRVGQHKVVVVGGGLGGLAAAVDLGVHGIPCVLLDDNNTVSLGSRSIAQGKRTLEIATRLGVADRMTAKGVHWSKGNTLIGNRLIYSFDLLPEGNEKYQAFLALPQYYVESILIERARELGCVDIRWLSRVVAVRQDGDGVDLDIETPEGSYAIRAQWVIACDGVRSQVRQALGITFEGTSFVDKFVICDVKMAFKFPPQRMFWFAPTFDKSNISLMHQQPDSIWRIDWQLGPDDDPEIERAPERVNQRLATMFGPDVPFETQFASIYAFEVRRIEKFRHGRVFFAGDAAHQLSPFGGGRGGNSAIQDVDNLVWKLAHVIRGAAPERLLDSYDAERIPVADENMQLSRRAVEFISPTSAHSLALRNAVLTLAPHHAFAKVMINTGRLSVAPNLRGSALLTPDAEPWDTAVTPGSAAIDAPLGENDWLVHHLTGGFVLLCYAERRADIGAGTLAALAALGRGPVAVRAVIALAEPGATIADLPAIHDRTSLLRKRYDLKPGSAYLFRPDQHVVARWRALDADRVRAAVQRSLGEPIAKGAA